MDEALAVSRAAEFPAQRQVVLLFELVASPLSVAVTGMSQRSGGRAYVFIPMSAGEPERTVRFNHCWMGGSIRRGWCVLKAETRKITVVWEA